ncbi:MAG: hypothetical protein IJB48_05750 [Clostridia bacterium]|nr:hypothetical protein [Clostridia bacterium]
MRFILEIEEPHIQLVQFLYQSYTKIPRRVGLSVVISATRNDGDAEYYNVSGIENS